MLSLVETEMFKAWADNHPTLFTSAVFDFMQQHPAPEWEVTVSMRTPNRILFTAKRVKADS